VTTIGHLKLGERDCVTRRTRCKLAALACFVLLSYGLNRPGFEKAGNIASTVLFLAMVAYAAYNLYDYAMWNLAKARKRNDELK
jgi:hypothetical protein